MTTYSIHLDDVDMALLPLRTRIYNDFLKKDLYQFQVMKTDIVEQPERTILYTCHICAIEVPAAFAREHTASIKHRANARIASVAAQRTRALITALPPPAAASTARFCANCATTVGKNHEKTKEHRVSVMHDKMLWELMTAYVDDDGVSNYDSEDSDTDLSIKGEAFKDYNGFGTWDVNGEEETQKKCDRTSKTIETANKEKNIKETTEDNQYKDKKDKYNKTKISDTDHIESNSNGERTDGTSKYRETEIKTVIETETKKEDNATSSKPKAAEIKIEYVEFVTRDNKLVKVLSDYYHSFTRKADTINCIVCTSVFKNEEVDSHMFSLKHLNKMPSTLIDEHCVRQINDTYSHCILCNQMVKNSNVTKHHLTFSHVQREKQAVTDQSTTSKIDKTFNMDVASFANINVAGSASNGVIKMKAQAVTATPTTAKIDKAVNINEASSANQAAVKLLSYKLLPDFKLKAPEKAKNEANTSIEWPVIYPYELTKQDSTVRCVICDCQVPNNQENRKSHLVGLNHATNVKNKRSNDASTRQPDGSRYLSSRSVVEPPGETRTEPTTSVSYENSYEATEDRNALLCVICGTRVVNSPYHLREHLNGVIHACHKENIRKEKRKEAQRKLKRKAASLSGKATQPTQEPKTYTSTSDTIRKNKPTNCYLSWV